MKLNATQRNYSFRGLRDTDDIFKVIDSKVEVTGNISQICTSPSEANTIKFAAGGESE